MKFITDAILIITSKEKLTQAWEIMSDPKKRRQWDSCDPKISYEIPKPNASGDFFQIYTSVFKREARFSKKVVFAPALGDMESTREQVEEFYAYWFAFESWRSFECMDEEDSEKSDGRHEKRWIERKNKSQRQTLKKEDNVRMAKFVEQAFSLDPRIRKFRDDEKKAKETKRMEKELVSKAGEIEAAQKVEVERIAREASEVQEKLVRDEEKKNREASKNAVKKEKKTIKRMLRDNNNFLASNASPDATLFQLSAVETILEFYNVQQLEVFRVNLEAAASSGVDGLLLAFDEELMAVEELKAAGSAPETKVAKADIGAVWAAKECDALKKAISSFPGGTASRWTKISEAVCVEGIYRSAKECLAKAKSFIPISAPKAAPKAAAAKADISSEPAANVKKADPVSVSEIPTMLVPEKSDWTTKQQLALEAGLRQFPASSFTGNPGERWVKIAGVVPDKSVKHIKARMKALADLVKNSKK